MALKPHAQGPQGYTRDDVSDQLAHPPAARTQSIGLTYAQTYTNTDLWSERVALTAEDVTFSKIETATDEKILPSPACALTGMKRKRRPKTEHEMQAPTRCRLNPSHEPEDIGHGTGPTAVDTGSEEGLKFG